ncbi:hypothetical protein IP90_03141 [Luteimonas cucumeris]|uniref:Uncharacterized protein n=1 Tax=Luteimonas cucumeris TaxID=985012 RepID=A0A562KVI5_9GAMM|nr:hypothetical protein [Luteimonas cucumeris]TWH99402.1 hypothetical protein IP90_03141 [Luteimonas cucumeris]
MSNANVSGHLLNTYITGANALGVSSGTSRGSVSGSSANSWYEAMSRAWGQTLDSQAARITQLSDMVGAGQDQPSVMIQLTAESLRMQFMSNNAATSQNAVGQALETLGKRQ